MSKSNLHALSQPEMTSNDPLHELIRQGARDLIARAVETELEGLLSQYADIKTADGRQAVVRNGYLPKRTIQTGVGDVEVQVPKVRDRSGAGICFNSHLLPPYLKRALSKVFPDTRHQRCWVHKTANVLDKLPKSVQPKVKSALHEIYLAETRDSAHKAFNSTLSRFRDKYPKAMENLEKDRDELLAFYDFPAIHWIHLRTTNPIESTFATVRLRTKRSRSCGSRDTTLSMVFKLLQSAQKRWKRIKGFDQLKLVVDNVQFQDGIQVDNQSDRNAA